MLLAERADWDQVSPKTAAKHREHVSWSWNS